MELRSVGAARKGVAYHQAGHAVVGALLGARVESVEIWDGPPPGGRVRAAGLDEQAGPPSDHDLVRLIAYRMAGPIAERIAEGGSMALQGDPGYRASTLIMQQFRQPETVDDATDEGLAARLLLDHFGEREEEAATAVDHLARIIEGWVWDHWHAIDVVAGSLLRYGQRTSAEFLSTVPTLRQRALFSTDQS
jgi:hypothetical protein